MPRQADKALHQHEGVGAPGEACDGPLERRALAVAERLMRAEFIAARSGTSCRAIAATIARCSA